MSKPNGTKQKSNCARWTQQEISLLSNEMQTAKGVTRDQMIDSFLDKFPGRTKHSLSTKLSNLIRSGKMLKSFKLVDSKQKPAQTELDLHSKISSAPRLEVVGQKVELISSDKNASVYRAGEAVIIMHK